MEETPSNFDPQQTNAGGNQPPVPPPQNPVPQAPYTPPAAQPVQQYAQQQPINPGYTQPQPVQPQVVQPQATSKRSKLVLLATALMLVSVIVAAAVFVLSSSNSASLTRFEDPNFTMMVPESWSGDAGYEPGKTLIFYYSPEDSSDENREKAASLTVFVGSQEDRIDDQIKSLDQQAADYTILVDETVNTDEASIRYVEIVLSPIETPDRQIRIASAESKRGDFIINADISGLEEHWGLHKDVAPRILQSIVPACENPQLELALTASAVNLCE